MRALLLAILVTGVACHAHSHGPGSHTHGAPPAHEWTPEGAEKPAKKKPLPPCPVTGETPRRDVFTEVGDGERIHFCCDSCRRKFMANPEKYGY